MCIKIKRFFLDYEICFIIRMQQFIFYRLLCQEPRKKDSPAPRHDVVGLCLLAYPADD